MTTENEQDFEEEIETVKETEINREKSESNPETKSGLIFNLVATEKSCSYVRLSSAHPYVDERPLSYGEEYVVDTEKKEITFPGKNESSKIKDVMVREYPSPDQDYFCINWIRNSGFGEHAISFLKMKE